MRGNPSLNSVGKPGHCRVCGGPITRKDSTKYCSNRCSGRGRARYTRAQVLQVIRRCNANVRAFGGPRYKEVALALGLTRFQVYSIYHEAEARRARTRRAREQTAAEARRRVARESLAAEVAAARADAPAARPFKKGELGW